MIDVVMPQMGESIVEGTLTKWLKKAGEHVERDEPLFEISTDKVDTEIPSPAAGTLARDPGGGRQDGRDQHRGRTDHRRRWRERRTGAARRDGAQARGSRSPLPPAAAAAAAAASALRRIEAPVAVVEETAGPLSPLVRKMARENNIDLAQSERHRRGRTHHQAGSGSLSGVAPLRPQAHAASARRPAPAASTAAASASACDRAAAGAVLRPPAPRPRRSSATPRRRASSR